MPYENYEPALPTQPNRPHVARSVYDAGSWRSEAACKDMGNELFFLDGKLPGADGLIKLAKAICNDCVSRDACLEFAIMTGQENGIWGGQTEEERRVIRRQRRSERRRSSRAV